MCLQERWDDDRVQKLLPTEPFYVYKVVDVRADKLESPHYRYTWHAGEHAASPSYKSLDAGFYVMFVPPGPHTLARTAGRSGAVVLRMIVDPKDVRLGGPDAIYGHKAVCLVVSRVTVTEEDMAAARAGEGAGYDLSQVIATAKKQAKKAKKTAKKKTADTTQELTKEKPVKKSTKKAAKKAVKAAKKAEETAGLSLDVLRMMLKAAKVKGVSKMTRAQLIEALKKLQADAN